MFRIFSKQGYICLVGILFCAVYALNATALSQFQTIQQILKALLLLCYLIAFASEFNTGAYLKSVSKTHTLLKLFTFLVIIYGLFSGPHIGQLFPISCVLFIYWFSYHYSKRGLIETNFVKFFSILLFITATWVITDAILFKLSYTTLDRAGGMNVGYTAVGAMLFLMLFYKDRWALILLTLSFVLTLFAMKRGAVFSGLAIFIVVFRKYLKESLTHFSMKHIVLFALLLFGFFYIVSQNQEVLFHRMDAESMQGGSGRDEIYSTIRNRFLSSDPLAMFFGHGFFTVTDMTFADYGGGGGEEGFYAHSDLYEVIWDHGIVGTIIYGLLLFNIYKYFKNSRYYSLYVWAFMLPVLVKAYLSGVYCTLWGQFPFLLLGYLQGKEEYLLKNNIYEEPDI